MTDNDMAKIARLVADPHGLGKYAMTDERLALRARVAKLEAAAIDVAASLAAAISLLERGGKKAAPSDKMFEQMLVDYRNSLERARAALKDARQ